MKCFPNLVLIFVVLFFLSSCYSSRGGSAEDRKTRKTTLTGVTPTIKNPSRGVINASGDGLTPGIGSANGAGSEENAIQIANNAILKAKTAFNVPSAKLDSLSSSDFVITSAIGITTQISINKMATQKANSKRIKAFAERVLKSSQEMQKELKLLSIRKNVVWPDSVSSGFQTVQAGMQASKDDFDLNYLQMMIDMQRRSIRSFESANTMKDSSIKVFIGKYLPMLKVQLLELQELSAALNK